MAMCARRARRSDASGRRSAQGPNLSHEKATAKDAVKCSGAVKSEESQATAENGGTIPPPQNVRFRPPPPPPRSFHRLLSQEYV